jgi:hypothetical protein
MMSMTLHTRAREANSLKPLVPVETCSWFDHEIANHLASQHVFLSNGALIQKDEP